MFFDNFRVTHEHGRILEENHYYAYGLRNACISSRAYGAPGNEYGYQGDYSELDEDIGWNDFELRNYDAQTGRFIEQDPYGQFASGYMGMGNDPINMIDPSGGFSLAGITGTSNLLLNTAVTTIGGAMIGGIIGMATGDDNAWKVGAATGLAIGIAGSVNWGDLGSLFFSASVSGTNLVAKAQNPYAQYIGNSPTWGSKWPANVHQQANAAAIKHSANPNINLKAKAKLKILNKATVDMDKDQSGEGSYKHAMSNRNLDPASAKIKADNFVKDQLRKAKILLKGGEIRDAYYEFGNALHTLQDATSPAHYGFQEWNGDETHSQQGNHVKQEVMYPGPKSNLQWVTNLFLDWFESSNDIIPKANFFDIIFRDHL